MICEWENVKYLGDRVTVMKNVYKCKDENLRFNKSMNKDRYHHHWNFLFIYHIHD